MLPTLIRFLICLSLCAAPVFVAAFEVGEFKSGMAQERVLQLLRSQGFKITKQSPTSVGWVYDSRVHSAGFCNGRLTYYSPGVPGGIQGFIRRVTQLTNQYGQGEFRSVSSETNVGELNSLSVTWVLGADTLRVTYFAASKQTAESQQVQWFSPSECREQMQ